MLTLMMKQKKSFLAVSGIFGVLVLLIGCSYTTQSRLSPHIKTLSVGVFDNQTNYLHIEGKLTSYLIAEIEHSPRYQVVNDGSADAELTGEIIEVRNTIQSYDANQQPRDSVVAVVVRFSLYDKQRNMFLVTNRQVSSSQSSSLAGRYFVDRGDSFDSALDVALNEAALNVVRDLMIVKSR